IVQTDGQEREEVTADDDPVDRLQMRGSHDDLSQQRMPPLEPCLYRGHCRATTLSLRIRYGNHLRTQPAAEGPTCRINFNRIAFANQIAPAATPFEAEQLARSFVAMGVTLADISREAGVSITTVSKVLAGKGVPFRISKKTQEKIWRIARELDYAPDLHARSLRAGRSNQIGIVVAHFNDPWYGQVIHGLETVLESKGYGFLINSVEEEPEKLTQRVSRMRANRVEGLIIVGSRLELPDDVAELLRKSGVPVVLVNRKSQWPWVCSIYFDHTHTGFVAMKHLL